MDEQELCFTSAVDLARLVRERHISPVDIMRSLVRRIERVNPGLNALCTLTLDAALDEAKVAEQRVMQPGETLGPLHGVPCSIKDVTATRGVRTTLGSRLYAENVPTEDAPIVERLKAAGALVIGKTNTPELGWKGATDNLLFGASRNPWDATKTPGGSSGGAAAAVASGLGPLATGTDGAGSIRIPASFCGIGGYKPSFGRVPNYPPSAAELVAHAGPMTRTVRDAALMLDVMAGPDERDRSSLPGADVNYLHDCDGGIAGLRVAWSATLGFSPIEPAVRDIVERAARSFGALGCSVEAEDPGFPDPGEALSLLFYSGVGARVTQGHPEWRSLIDPGLTRAVDQYRHASAFDVAGALFTRARVWDAMRTFFDRYDLLLTPTMPLTAFPLGKDFPETVAGQCRPNLLWTPFTYVFNLTGQPAITVPCGWSSEGLPVGLQIVGRRYDDATVLRAARAFEQLQPWADRRPPVDG